MKGVLEDSFDFGYDSVQLVAMFLNNACLARIQPPGNSNDETLGFILKVHKLHLFVSYSSANSLVTALAAKRSIVL